MCGGGGGHCMPCKRHAGTHRARHLSRPPFICWRATAACTCRQACAGTAHRALLLRAARARSWWSVSGRHLGWHVQGRGASVPGAWCHAMQVRVTTAAALVPILGEQAEAACMQAPPPPLPGRTTILSLQRMPHTHRAALAHAPYPSQLYPTLPPRASAASAAAAPSAAVGAPTTQATSVRMLFCLHPWA